MSVAFFLDPRFITDYVPGDVGMSRVTLGGRRRSSSKNELLNQVLQIVQSMDTTQLTQGEYVLRRES